MEDPLTLWAVIFGFWILMLMGQHQVTWSGKIIISGIITLALFVATQNGITADNHNAGERIGVPMRQAIERMID